MAEKMPVTNLALDAPATTEDIVEDVKKIVLHNRRIAIREVADYVNISVGSCHAIFSDVLDMRRVSAKFVPKLSNIEMSLRRS